MSRPPQTEVTGARTPLSASHVETTVPGDSATQPARALLDDICAALDRRRIVYAILRGREALAGGAASDIDFVLEQDPREVIEPVLHLLQAQGRCLLVQRLHYDVPHCYYYILAIRTGSEVCYLHLDCLHDPVGINAYLLTSGDLLQERRREDGVWVARPGHLAAYLLIKRLRKGRLDAGTLALVAGAVQADGAAFDRLITRYGGERTRVELMRLVEAAPGEDIGAAARAVRGHLYRKRYLRRPRLLARRMLRRVARVAGRLVRPSGLFVVLLGPDGSGKTTVAGRLGETLAGGYRRQQRFHWRPGLLPKPGEPSAPGRPPMTPRYGRLVSALRYAYYLADFILGGLVRIVLPRVRSTLVLAERYHHDLLVHPARYAFSLPRWLFSIGARLVPRPDLLVLLSGDARLIAARKDELTADEIARQLEAYADLLASEPHPLVVDTGVDSARVVAAIAWRALLRTAEKNGLYHPVDEPGARTFAAFPSRSAPRLYIDAARVDRHGFRRLFDPSSVRARLVKAVAGRMPSGLWQLLLRRNGVAAAEGGRLSRYTQRLQDLFGPAARLDIMYYQGTRGREEKLTAQLTSAATIIGYAKIAETAPARALVANEEAVLRDLERRPFKAATQPVVLDTSERDGVCLLALSPPPGHWWRRPVDAGGAVRAFLSELGRRDRARCAPDALLPAPDYLGERPDLAALHQAAAAYVRRMAVRTGLWTSFAHGDFAPWNLRTDGAGALFAFDWEYAAQNYPALFDVLHYRVMPALLVRGREPIALAHGLLSAASPAGAYVREQAAAQGLDPEHIPVYLVAYLWRMLTRVGAPRAAGETPARPVPARGAAFKSMLDYVLAREAGGSNPAHVLVSAYACEPGQGSEPGVGWSAAEAIAVDHHAWVITRANNRPTIEQSLQTQPNLNLHVRYVDLPRWTAFWKRGERGVRPYYYLWQFAAWFEARRLMRCLQFSRAHHVTFVNDWLFTFLALLPLPFVWGPIGSCPLTPAGLALDRRALLRDRARYALQALMRHLDPLFWLSLLRARRIVCISPEVAGRSPLRWVRQSKLVLHPAVGVEDSLILPGQTEVAAGGQGPFTVLCLGRLLPIKGFHLALAAFAEFGRRGGGARLSIIGDGPARRRLEELARALGIAARVSFLGWRPRGEALAALREADVLLHPSFESGGMVVLEAMAQAVPVVCLDDAGPGALVASAGGHAVPAASRAQTVAALADALTECRMHPEQAREQAALTRARAIEQFAWSRRPAVLAGWYR